MQAALQQTERRDGRGKSRQVKFAFGLTIFAYVSYATLFEAAPRLGFEWVHAAEFVPAYGSHIVSARCTTLNGFMFNTCDVKATTASGQTVSLNDKRFGHAPTGAVSLLQRPGNPTVYSTDVSLRTLNQRLYFMMFAAPLSVLLFIGGGMLVARKARLRSRFA